MSLDQKKILKNIAVFGSVQFLSLLAGVVRSKFAALWLGVDGVGFLGLILTAFSLITAAFSLGLPISLVKYIAGSSEDYLPKKIRTAQAVSIFTGITGGILCFVFAGPISVLTFKTEDFTWVFQLISVAVVFKQIAGVYLSIMQGRSYLKKLANANVLANLIGILFTIPLYYFFKLNGVVYNVVVVGFVELVVFYLFFKTAREKSALVEKQYVITESKKILGDGFFYSVSGFLALLAAYVVQVYISSRVNFQELGFYIAGSTILNTYVSVLFIAMSYDYLPRISKQTTQAIVNEAVGNQLFSGIIILLPVLLILLVLAPVIVEVLYSKKFAESIIYVQIGLLGIFFKLFSWTLGFVIIAKGTRKMILYNAIIYNAIFVGMHIFGYYWGGLRGIAIASCIYFLIHLAGNYWLTHTKLNISINRRYLRNYVGCAFLLALAIGVNFLVPDTFIKNTLLISASLSAGFWSLKHFRTIFKHKI